MAKRTKTGGGSRKGKPNKFTTDVRAMIVGALEAAGGKAYLEKQASENPPAFLALLGKTLPKEVKIDPTGALKLTISLSGGA